jgi:hypothetical protein
MIAEAEGEEEDPSDDEIEDLLSTEPPQPQGSVGAQLDEVEQAELLSPALDLEACNLKELSTEDQDIALQLFMDDIYNGPLWRTFIEQLNVIVDTFRNREQQMSWRLIGSIFKSSKGAVYQHYIRGRRAGAGVCGRPSVLSPSEKEWLQSLIVERFRGHMPISYAETLNEIELQCFKSILPSTLRKMVSRFGWCKTVEGIPKASDRVFCSEDDIDRYYTMLEETLTGAPSAVIYNVDEVGCDDWADKVTRHVIVPAEYDKPSIDIPISRTDSRASMVACIAADGRPLKPVIILPRKTAGIVSNWNPDAQALVCRIDRQIATEVRHWNGVKTRIPIPGDETERS